MSDLQKTFAKAKLASYPATMPPELFPVAVAAAEEETDHFDTELPQDDDSSSASSASSASSTGTIIPSQNQKLFARPQGQVERALYYLFPLLTRTFSEAQTKEPWNKYHGPPISSASSP